ncbi:MAG: Do family serine endopeptidase [Elusimicrobia bacterium]|nr:Do family serine endopeptidase [Elusimicrobiota bacterium]
MDKKNLIILLVILIGGLAVSRFVKPPAGKFPQKSYVNRGVKKSPETIKKEGINRPQSFSGVIIQIQPALVNISAVHIVEVQSPFYRFYHGDPFSDFFDDFFGGRPERERPEPETHRQRQEGTGSGFIVGAEGYVLTNYHVIKDAQELNITTYDGKTYDAELVGKDERTDLAVIRIKSNKKFNVLKLGDSDNIRIGDWVVAAGSPFGLNQTFTAGIISALRQDVDVENTRYKNMLQTDAAINRCNSGGPLVNLAGEVVGINTAIFAPTGVFSGVGFAISVNDAKEVLGELIEKGRVVRGWLGVEISNVDSAIKKNFALDSEKGVLINRVVENSPAETAGLKRADVIVEFNGRKIQDENDLQQKVSETPPGDNIKLGIIREGKKTDIDITLSEMPEEIQEFSKPKEPENGQIEQKTAEWLGITVTGISAGIKERYSLSTDKGVVVINIDPAAGGYEIGLIPGDAIIEMNKIKTSSLAGFKKAAKEILLKEGVVLDVIRGGRPLFISYQKAQSITPP